MALGDSIDLQVVISAVETGTQAFLQAQEHLRSLANAAQDVGQAAERAGAQTDASFATIGAAAREAASRVDNIGDQFRQIERDAVGFGAAASASMGTAAASAREAASRVDNVADQFRQVRTAAGEAAAAQVAANSAATASAAVLSHTVDNVQENYHQVRNAAVEAGAAQTASAAGSGAAAAGLSQVSNAANNAGSQTGLLSGLVQRLGSSLGEAGPMAIGMGIAIGLAVQQLIVWGAVMAPILVMMTVWLGVATAFVAGWTAIIGILGIAVGGLAAAGAGVVLLANHFGLINGPIAAFKQAWEGVGSTLAAQVAPMAASIVTWLTAWAPLIQQIGQEAATWFSGVLGPSLDFAGHLVKDFLGALRPLGAVFAQLATYVLQNSGTFDQLFKQVLSAGVGIVQGLANNLIKFSNWFIQHLPQIEKIAKEGFDKIGSAIQTVLQAFGRFVEWGIAHWPQIKQAAGQAADAIGKAFSTMGTIFNALKPVFDKFVEGFKFAGQHTKEFAIALGIVMAPIILVVAAVLALVAVFAGLVIGITVVITYIGQFVGWLRGAIPQAIGFVANFIGSSWAWIQARWTQAQNFIVGLVGAFWGWVQNTFNGALQWVMNIVHGAWNWIQTRWYLAHVTITAYVSGFWQWVQNAFNTALNWVMNVVHGAWNWIQTRWYLAHVTIMAYVSGFWTWLQSMWNGLVQWITQTVQNLWQWVQDRWNQAHQFIQNLVNGFWSWLQNAWNSLVNWITQTVQNLWNTVQNLWDTAHKTVEGMVDNFSKTVQDKWNQFKDGMASIGKSIANTIIDDLEKGLNGAIGLIRGFIQGVNGLLSKIPGFQNPLAGAEGALKDMHFPRLATGGQLPGGVPARGVGQGFVAQGPTFIRALVGEGRSHEFVIPTETRYRDNAVKLWRQAGAELGLMGQKGRSPLDQPSWPGQFAVGGILSGVQQLAGGGIPTSGHGGQCLAFVCQTSGIGCGIPAAKDAAGLCNSNTPEVGDIFVATGGEFGHAGFVYDNSNVLDSNWDEHENIMIHPLSDVQNYGGICYIKPGQPFGGASPQGGGGGTNPILALVRAGVDKLAEPFVNSMKAIPGFAGMFAGGTAQSIVDAVKSLIPASSGGNGPTGGGDISQLCQIMQQVGFNADCNTAKCIVMRESGGNPAAIGPAFGGDSGSVGWFQVQPSAHPSYDVNKLKDPTYNTWAAGQIYAQAGGWGPWSTHGSCGVETGGVLPALAIGGLIPALCDGGVMGMGCNCTARGDVLKRHEAGGIMQMLAAGGMLRSYDRGGAWPSGTLGVNMSGKTEHVSTGDSMTEVKELLKSIDQKLSGGVGGGNVHLNYQGYAPMSQTQAHEMVRDIRFAQQIAGRSVLEPTVKLG